MHSIYHFRGRFFRQFFSTLIFTLGVSVCAKGSPGQLDPVFLPSVNGAVYRVAVQPDFKVVVGGEFTLVEGQKAVRVARFLSNGNLDATFNPGGDGFNSTVSALALSSNNKIFVGGSFTLANGVARGGIARVNQDGTLDQGFAAGETLAGGYAVLAVAPLPDGGAIVGGNFPQFNGLNTHPYVAKLLNDGSLDPNFKPTIDAAVYSVVVDSLGGILIGGNFTIVNGQPRVRLARLNLDGTLDPVFNPGGGANSTVRTIVETDEGQFLIGGSFSLINGAPVAYLARISPNGLPDLTFSPAVNSTVYDLVLQQDGRAIICGDFTLVQGIGRNRMARILNDGGLDATWDIGSGFVGQLFTLGMKTDGKVLAGGNFSSFNGVARTNLVRIINTNDAAGGEISFSRSVYQASENQATVGIEVLRSGNTSAAVSVNYATSSGTANAGDYTPATGQLSFLAGETKKLFAVTIKQDAIFEVVETVNLTLSNPSAGAVLGIYPTAQMVIADDDISKSPGSLDVNFAGSVSGVGVYDMATQTDGKTVLTGDFNGVHGVGRMRIARINLDGTLDPGFNPSAWLDLAGFDLALQNDGKILVSGVFNTVNGIGRGGVARLMSDGTLDGSFNLGGAGAGGGYSIYAVGVLPGGEIVVGGNFPNFNGVNGQGYLVKLSAQGALDTSFKALLNGNVYAITVDDLGKILIGGDFTQADGVPRTRLARLNADGHVDTSFDPAGGPNATVRKILVDDDGHILIAGIFNQVNGLSAGYFARLSPNGLPDTTFQPGINSSVYSAALQSDGGIIVGGFFSLVNGLEKNRLARILPDGSLDKTFDTGSGVTGTIYAVSSLPDGNVLAGGTFTSFNGFNRTNLVKVVATNTAAGGEINFSRAIYQTTEGQSPIGIEVRRTGNTNATVTVNYSTSNGSANAGDYSVASGELTFVAGEVKKLFKITIKQDTTVEPQESLNLTLSTPGSGAALGPQSVATLLINDDDQSSGLGSLNNSFKGWVEGAGVYALKTLPNGKTLVAGDFTGVNGFGRLRIARLNINGSVDDTFNPSAWMNAASHSLNIQNDQKILISGTFTTINGVLMGGIARLNSNGTLDPGFTLEGTGAGSYSVFATAILSGGDILLGGNFFQFNGLLNRNYLVKLFSDGSLDTSFNPGVNGSVYSIAVDENGKFLIGGDFTGVDGRVRNRLARLTADGKVDDTFNPGGGPNATVRQIVLDDAGNILIGGFFNQVNGSSSAHLARLSPQGIPDLTFSPAVNQPVYGVALQADGRIVVGGNFNQVGSQDKNRLVRLLDDGSIDKTFDIGSGIVGSVYSVAVRPDGNVLVGGAFTSFNGLPQTNLVLIQAANLALGGEISFSQSIFSGKENAGNVLVQLTRTGNINNSVTINYATSDGTASSADYAAATGQITFAPGVTEGSFAVPLVNDPEVENDELINLILSSPTGGSVLGPRSTAMLRIENEDIVNEVGSLNTSFTAGANGPVYAIKIQDDGKTLLAGEFSGVNNVGRLRIARVNSDGSLDPTFSPGVWLSAPGLALALQEDRKILVGGQFTIVNGVANAGIARLNPNGTVDNTFVPGTGAGGYSVYTISVLPDGDFIVGGNFYQFNDLAAHRYLVKLFSDGTVDTSFKPAVNSTVYSTAVDDQGRILIGGDFTEVEGQPVYRVARLTADGHLDPAFNAGTGPNSTVRALSILPDGSILAGGFFNAVNSKPVSYLAHFAANGTLDESYPGKPGSLVYSLFTDNAHILVGGSFSQMNGVGRTNFARLNLDGNLDPSFLSGSGANGIVYTATGNPTAVLIGGAFTQVDEVNRNNIARLLGVKFPTGVKITKFEMLPPLLQVTATSTAGQTQILQTSEDLVLWKSVATNQATGPSIQLSTPKNQKTKLFLRTLVQ